MQITKQKSHDENTTKNIKYEKQIEQRIFTSIAKVIDQSIMFSLLWMLLKILFDIRANIFLIH